MATDFSRVRANPLLDYAGVQLKQGAVLLDSDANELVAIFDRRLRALAGDVLGRATVGSNTPDAFRITRRADGGLDIGPGRLYVDGLLAENHGMPDPAQRVFDVLMAEPRFSAPVPYTVQPYLPNAPALPSSGRHLVYLDVWNREVTHVETPDLVESAVGVDASSRVQTVWQVHVLPEVARNTSCGSPDAEFPGWTEHIAPSTGRLTTGTYEVAAALDPCELPPTGGYRGLENQLYRVEIHDAGAPGTATFKWSRENASVCSRVSTCISAGELELDSLGRDEVLRLNQGDWVEITDDVREFAQRAGEIRRIDSANNATRRITLSAALPADLLPAAFPDSTFPQARNMRVRRWDQNRQVLRATTAGATTIFQDLDANNSTGTITVPPAGTTLILENGVTVSFDSVGPKGFRTGDYWVFAARTADASVEALEQAPPRGIHHHYARLSLWDAGTENEPSDCRHRWPPAGGGDDCACTQCVSPEGPLTIEEAVRRVQDTGGTICLQPGEYTLSAPVRISGGRPIRIRGQGKRQATILIAPNGAFSIDNCTELAIENLSILNVDGRTPTIDVRDSSGIALHELAILVMNDDAPASAIALSGEIVALSIRDNIIGAPFGIRGLDRHSPEPLTELSTLGMRIEGNMMLCPRRAVDFEGPVLHQLGSYIVDNELLGCREPCISMLGSVAPGSSMHIDNNTLSINGPGIRCGGDGAWISGNKLAASPLGERSPTGSGISLLADVDVNGSDQCQLLANQISGFPDAGILIDAPVQELICKLNIIENCGNGIVMTPPTGAGVVSIENNHLRDIGTARARPALGPFVYGISVQRARSANVVGNTLRRIGLQAVPGIESIAGIALLAVRNSRVTGNTILEIGPTTALASAQLAGVLMIGPYTQNEVSGNHVERDAISAAPDGAMWFAVRLEQPTATRPIIHVANFSAVHLAAGRMLVFNGTHAFAEDLALDISEANILVPRQGSTTMRGNTFRARGAAPAVTVQSGAVIQFGDNRCELVGGAESAVVLNSAAAVVNSNVVSGGETSIRLTAPMERVTIIGNVTNNRIVAGSNNLTGTPWERLNVEL
ncbi:MAG TPA: DUF6519 domain-containing protein [Steroidobacteraceae bacterium]|nr:DUF6519 domain-containing protein [Steroidobacteraceae bacterium]